MIPTTPIHDHAYIQTKFGKKRYNFIDRTGHVCANGWKVTEHAGNCNGSTLWKSACVKCGEPHRWRGVETKVEFKAIEKRRACKCGNGEQQI